MQAQSLGINYRPLRIGFCVRSQNMDDIRRALSFTHTLCGGRFNPLIPVDDAPFAAELVRIFRVDALYPVADDSHLHNFVASFPYLAWPNFEKDLFVGAIGARRATLLDIYHQVTRIAKNQTTVREMTWPTAKIFHWEPTDPLRDILLAYFGSYPDAAELGLDYQELVIENLGGQLVKIGSSDGIPPDGFKALSPSAISAYGLEWDRPPHDLHNPGIYCGNVSDFTDVLTFWNLRAADIDVVFYDPSDEKRLKALKDSVVEHLEKRPTGSYGWEDRTGVWSKSHDLDLAHYDWGKKPIFCAADETFWASQSSRPPLMQFGPQWAFASIMTEESPPTIKFQLPDKPFEGDPWFHTQKLVVSVHTPSYVGLDDRWTFYTPFVQELNPFYGRRAFFVANDARAEVNGLGVITSVTSHDLTIRALAKWDLFAQLFGAFGMEAVPSPAGRIAARLIQQMGGLQGCRVFKIAGVRRLIGTYGPLDSFTRSAATQVIGEVDPVTHRPNFARYEDLYIEYREGGKLTPDDVFTFLLKKHVFRAGLDLLCPNCEMKFWVHLDEVGTEVPCDLCNTRFDITPQLKDRDWAYRRSGLFGKDDRQQGAVPVALTLQQIDTIISSMNPTIAITSMEIKPKSAKVVACETDFVVAARGFQDRVQLAIGECKAGGPGNEITEDDVTKLTGVADAFPADRIEVFIVFSKTGAFSPEEIERCKKAQSAGELRVILLSERELEPYFVYERTAKEFEIRPSAISLEDLARTTQDVFFEPKPRNT